ncbi:MAG: iron-containing alcohol dehydrogenase family protein [Cyanobium sp.]
MDVSPVPDGPLAQAIAPALMLRGAGAWQEARPSIATLLRRPLLLGRSPATAGIRDHLTEDLLSDGLQVTAAELRFDCCEEDLGRLAEQISTAGCDGVIAVGGGKVLDAGKLLADRLDLPCVTVPTSAATCAGWTALANVYSPEGAFRHDRALRRCPELLVFDHDLVRQAPARTLVSGVADAMAKWYEASVASGCTSDGLVQQAVQMARVLRDQLLLEAASALADPGGEAWVRVAEGCALSAGVIGGIGGSRCRTVAAHAVHNGLTQLMASHGCLHGEKVGFGILVQLRLEEMLAGSGLAGQARRQLVPFFQQLGLPVQLADLGLADASLRDLEEVVRFACLPESDLHQLPFAVSPSQLLAALVSTTAELQPA